MRVVQTLPLTALIAVRLHLLRIEHLACTACCIVSGYVVVMTMCPPRPTSYYIVSSTSGLTPQ